MTAAAAISILAVKVVVLLVSVLMATAYLTLAERRALARFQVRIGPNRVGPFGLLQPLADAVKLMGKENLVPAAADKFIFRLAPLMVMVPAFLVYAFIPLGPDLAFVNADAAVLMILAVSSFGVYGFIMAGLSSSNKYSAMGGMRSAAQLISYELTLTLSLVSVILVGGSMNVSRIVAAQETLPLILKQPLAFLLFLTAGMAEINRTPFDLPEAESELVGGYHTEYSGMSFGLFYLSEYVNILTMSLLGALFFLGGWNGPWLPGWLWLILKSLALVFFLLWTRGTILRFRYDQLMAFGWKFLLPLAVLNLLFTGAVVVLWL